MNRYALTADDRIVLAPFRLVLRDVNLETLKPNGELRPFIGKSGVYFWVMELNGVDHKIYAGRTNNLPRRIKEYTNGFQPGVPNDFKLRHFQSWMRAKHPEARLNLYFCEADDVVKFETRIINATKPFINEQKHGDAEAFRLAHERFCHQSFDNRLSVLGAVQ
jgi:hypothetical protein